MLVYLFPFYYPIPLRLEFAFPWKPVFPKLSGLDTVLNVTIGFAVPAENGWTIFPKGDNVFEWITLLELIVAFGFVFVKFTT